MESISLHTTSAHDLTSTWETYRETLSAESRNILILHYLPLVKFAAIRVLQRRGGGVEMDDLMQWGVFGLRDAIRSFDPARGVKFETYCVPRIRGSMLDGLKALQWAPRDVRSRLQHYNELQDQLQMEMGCKPDEQSLSARMGISREEYAALMRDTVACSVSSLHASCSESDGEKEMRQMDVLQDAREMQAADEVQHRDLRELFMKELTKNERLVMMLYYYDELTMREIGDVMGISGTRVSQMHSEIIARLRERLAKRITHCGGRPQVTMDI